MSENCALLDNYAASSDNSLRTFRDNLSVPSLRVNNRRFLFFFNNMNLTIVDGTDKLSRNVGKELPLLVA